MVNTYRWDYGQVAALVAPRPLLIANSDKDSIFPLEGVIRIHAQVRKIYQLHKAEGNLGLLITEGPHRDSQDLQLPVFRWFNRHLKGEDPPIEMAAVRFFEPQQLKVFSTLPADERTSKIHESFTPPPKELFIPDSAAEWTRLSRDWKRELLKKSFAAWPESQPPLDLERVSTRKGEGLVEHAYRFNSQTPFTLDLILVHKSGLEEPREFVLHILDTPEWEEWENLTAEEKTARFESDQIIALFAPRGLGTTAWNQGERYQTQLRRRFMLLGQTLDGMRVWDIRRAIQAVRALPRQGTAPLVLNARGDLGVNTLYASIFEPDIAELRLADLPSSHRTGPDYLNVLRVLDIPQAVAMAAQNSAVQLSETDPDLWGFPQAVGARLAWPANSLNVER